MPRRALLIILDKFFKGVMHVYSSMFMSVKQESQNPFLLRIKGSAEFQVPAATALLDEAVKNFTEVVASVANCYPAVGVPDIETREAITHQVSQALKKKLNSPGVKHTG